MRSAEKIRASLPVLTREFVEFAAIQPRRSSRPLTPQELEDSLGELVSAIADDMDQAPSHQAPSRQAPMPKADGDLPQHAPAITAFAQRHALTRLDQGYDLDQLVTEYRALRASMIRLLENGDPPARLQDVIRVSEAVDQALASSVSLYAREVERARELFIAILGHDLRNPLHAVMLSAEVLLADERLGSSAMPAAVRVRNSAARMNRMIEDVIDFTRTRLGLQLPTSPARVELGAVLAQVVDELRIASPSREIVYEPPPPTWGYWDGARIGQMLSNLIGNAVQHGDPAQPVTVGTRVDGCTVTVEIHNHGPAIAAEALDKIFEPLMRIVVQEAERRSGRPSVGLGLYVAREIVRAHSGTIEVDSSADRGTTFTVTLPCET